MKELQSPQAMQGSKEWITRSTSTGLAGSATGTPTSPCKPLLDRYQRFAGPDI